MHAFAGQPRLPDMDKKKLLRLITEKLAADLEVAVCAAQTAHETATHEENVAENKYDTLGLEAAYLAAGQSRRVEEIRQALGLYRNLVLRDFDEEQGIQLTALVTLLNADGSRRTVFLGPEAAGLKIDCEGREVLVITPRSPLGQSLIGRHPGDETGAKDSPCGGNPRRRLRLLLRRTAGAAELRARREIGAAGERSGARAPPQPWQNRAVAAFAVRQADSHSRRDWRRRIAALTAVMTAAVMTTALSMMTPTHQQPFEEPHGTTLSSGSDGSQ